MKKIGLTFVLVALTLYGSFLYADVELVENKPNWRAQVFIVNQIKGIGLVDSYQEDGEDRSYVYDNALAAIASMAMGNFGLAKEILDTLCDEVNNSLQEVPFESYNFSNGVGSGISNAGNSAWLLQALNIYQRLTKSKVYYSTQKRLADFLVGLQDAKDGALRGSKSEYWKSTEHNMIAYVALNNFGRLNRQRNYIIPALTIKKFLLGPVVWRGDHFLKGLKENGSPDEEKVTDVQALGVLLFGRPYANILSWAENNLRLSMPYNLEMVTGFDFNGDLDTVWLEGTLQAALAFYKSGNISQGDFYYSEAAKTIQDNGSVILATNTGTASDVWTLEPWRAIAPTSWLIFCYLKFNPLILYQS